ARERIPDTRGLVPTCAQYMLAVWTERSARHSARMAQLGCAGHRPTAVNQPRNQSIRRNRVRGITPQHRRQMSDAGGTIARAEEIFRPFQLEQTDGLAQITIGFLLRGARTIHPPCRSAERRVG